MTFLPYVLRGDKLRNKLDVIQDRINALLVERKTVDRAPMTVDEFKRIVGAQLTGKPSLIAIRARGQLMSRGAGAIEPYEPLNLMDLASLFGVEEIAELLTGIANSSPTQNPSMDSADREARLSAIEAELEQLQKDEELQVMALLDAGVRVARREDADPRVLLAVWQKED